MEKGFDAITENGFTADMKTKFKRLEQFTAGVWKVIGAAELFVVREEIGCDNGASIYSVTLRRRDPWNSTNAVRQFDSLQQADAEV